MKKLYDAIYKARLDLSPLKRFTGNSEVDDMLIHVAKTLDEALIVLEEVDDAED